MSAETVAYSTLSGASAVTDLVGTRIYPDFVPNEKTLPAVAINRSATDYINTIHSNVALGAIVTLEVWCMAATRAAAEGLADAVVATLGGGDFSILNRSPEFDSESEVFATVLTVSILE